QFKRGLTQSTGGLGTNNFVTILERADLPMVQNPGVPWSAPAPGTAGKKATRSRAISDEGQIETFTIVYVTPDGFLPPLALALIRDRNGGLVMAQGEDTAHLKIGREVYLRRLDDFYLFTVKSQLQKVHESLKRLLRRGAASPAREDSPAEEKP
ncbi:MAG TPA: OB-fold domain-containing protein, partial [Candidatus Binatia bacterium]|nr:OB-fold domain-containing protein [Candidatus Binatia bacterium]